MGGEGVDDARYRKSFEEKFSRNNLSYIVFLVICVLREAFKLML